MFNQGFGSGLVWEIKETAEQGESLKSAHSRGIFWLLQVFFTPFARPARLSYTIRYGGDPVST